MHLADRIRNCKRRDRPAHAPSGHAVSLRHPIDGDGPLAHSFQAGNRNVFRPIVKNVLVDLVGDGKHVKFHAQIANQFQLCASEYFSRRIIRSIQDDRLGLVMKRRPQFALVERPLSVRHARRTQFHKPRLGATQDRVRSIVLVERLEDHDFIARIAHRQQGRNHALG